jgi:glycosyltransferase involved in cell wall biosynthesis
MKICYLTGLDTKTYQRPSLAEMAIPETTTICYSGNRWLTKKNPVNMIYRGIRKTEKLFSKSSRVSGDYLMSGYFSDIINYSPFKNISKDALITLNTPLALHAKTLSPKTSVIVDWMDVWTWPWSQMNRTDIKTIERVDAVIFWSRPLMDVMTKRLHIKRAEYVPFGIDFRVFDPLRQGDANTARNRLGIKNKFVILYSGGLWRVKGVDLQGIDKVLKAFSLFSRNQNDVVLLLQLSKYDDQLLREIKDLGIANKVMLIGKLPYDDPLRQGLFSAADALVLPASNHPVIYYAERMKAFQYMAAAKPIVAEKTPGALSALGDTALYVKLDDVQMMAQAFAKLNSDRELRVKLGEKTRRRVETEYDWKLLVPKYREFILRTIN